MRGRWMVLALCLFIGLVVIGVGPVTAQSDTGAVGFSQGTVLEQRGDVATVGVELVGTDQATLLVSAAQQDYTANIELHDGNGDGRVRVLFNTFYGLDGGDGTAFEAADPGDWVAVNYQWTTQSLPVLDAGRYNLIASSGHSRVAAVLRLEDPTVGQSHSLAVAAGSSSHGETVPAPSSTSSTGGNVSVLSVPAANATDQATGTTVAIGDVANAEFGISGIEGALQGPAPGRRLVFANDSTPGAETTHLVQVSPDRNLTSVRTVTVDYVDSYGDHPPVYRGGLRTLGLDTDGDGRVDRSLRIAVSSIRTSTDGLMTVYFDRGVSIPAAATLLVEYPVTNPDMTGESDVRVELGNADAARGSVLYGPAGRGTLGNGIDLRIRDRAGGDEIVAPLSALDVSYDSTTSQLIATVDTTTLDAATYDVSLDVEKRPALDWSGASMSERITVEAPSVTLAAPTATGDDPSSLSIEARTNLAAGNRVIVQAELSSDRVVYLSRGVSVVDRAGTIDVEFGLPPRLNATTVTVTVMKDGRTLAGPTDFESPV